VTIQLYTTPSVPIDSITADQRAELADKNLERETELASDPINPYYVVLSPDGQLLGRKGGYNEPAVFAAFLNDALGKFNAAGKVAQVEGGR
jgi:hypothetical protein